MKSAFKKSVFKNGLRVILVPQASSLAASVLILVEAGSEYETKRTNGISHFLEHMVFKGTVTRPRPGMIAEELAALGAQFNAFTTQEFTGYWAKAEARKLPRILDIVSDLYLHPLFAQEEMEKERGVIIEELNMYEDTPMRKVQDVFMELMYGDQPAGWDVGGTKAIVRALARKDLIAYRTARYQAPATVVVIAGKFNEAVVRAQLMEAFAGLPRRAAPRKSATRERQSSPKILVKQKDSDQGHLALGCRAFDIFDKRRYALQVLANVLGGGMSSRLWKKVREEMGAAYYIHSDTEFFLDHGFLSVSAGVDHTKIIPVIRAILDECRTLREDLVPPDELQRSKDHMLGGLILGLETSDELASYYGGQEILTRTLLPPSVIMDRIKATTAEEVRAAARAAFHNKGLNLAVIGPYPHPSTFQNILTF